MSAPNIRLVCGGISPCPLMHSNALEHNVELFGAETSGGSSPVPGPVGRRAACVAKGASPKYLSSVKRGNTNNGRFAGTCVHSQDGDLKAIDFDSACCLSGGLASTDKDVAERVGSCFNAEHVFTPRCVPPARHNVIACCCRCCGVTYRVPQKRALTYK